MEIQKLERICDVASKSGKYNRFCTVKACTEVKVMAQYRDEPIFKIQYCQFAIGSDYYTRESNKQGIEVEQKRKSYYGNETDNGVIRYLLSKPEKKYIWVWKAGEKAYKSCYIDGQGKILDYVTEVKPKMYQRKADSYESPQRVFNLENVFELNINGETFKSDNAELYQNYLSLD